MDTPEKLFTKFLALAGIIQDCVRGCPIQLCFTYYTSLSRTISYRMMNSDDYTSPSLVGLGTKEAQLEVLQVFREGTTFQYKELAAEDERIDKKLKMMMKASGRNAQHYFQGLPTEAIKMLGIIT